MIETGTNKHLFGLFVREGRERSAVEREIRNHRQRCLLFAHTAIEGTDNFKPRLRYGFLGFG